MLIYQPIDGHLGDVHFLVIANCAPYSSEHLCSAIFFMPNYHPFTNELPLEVKCLKQIDSASLFDAGGAATVPDVKHQVLPEFSMDPHFKTLGLLCLVCATNEHPEAYILLENQLVSVTMCPPLGTVKWQDHEHKKQELAKLELGDTFSGNRICDTHPNSLLRKT